MSLTVRWALSSKDLLSGTVISPDLKKPKKQRVGMGSRPAVHSQMNAEQVVQASSPEVATCFEDDTPL